MPFAGVLRHLSLVLGPFVPSGTGGPSFGVLGVLTALAFRDRNMLMGPPGLLPAHNDPTKQAQHPEPGGTVNGCFAGPLERWSPRTLLTQGVESTPTQPSSVPRKVSWSLLMSTGGVRGTVFVTGWVTLWVLLTPVVPPIWVMVKNLPCAKLREQPSTPARCGADSHKCSNIWSATTVRQPTTRGRSHHHRPDSPHRSHDLAQQKPNHKRDHNVDNFKLVHC